eukprot:4279301-Amphidinium_carterae.1
MNVAMIPMLTAMRLGPDLDKESKYKLPERILGLEIWRPSIPPTGMVLTYFCLSSWQRCDMRKVWFSVATILHGAVALKHAVFQRSDASATPIAK